MTNSSERKFKVTISSKWTCYNPPVHGHRPLTKNRQIEKRIRLSFIWTWGSQSHCPISKIFRQIRPAQSGPVCQAFRVNSHICKRRKRSPANRLNKSPNSVRRIMIQKCGKNTANWAPIFCLICWQTKEFRPTSFLKNSMAIVPYLKTRQWTLKNTRSPGSKLQIRSTIIMRSSASC